jgi:hypothetical protein
VPQSNILRLGVTIRDTEASRALSLEVWYEGYVNVLRLAMRADWVILVGHRTSHFAFATRLSVMSGSGGKDGALGSFAHFQIFRYITVMLGRTIYFARALITLRQWLRSSCSYTLGRPVNTECPRYQAWCSRPRDEAIQPR